MNSILSCLAVMLVMPSAAFAQKPPGRQTDAKQEQSTKVAPAQAAKVTMNELQQNAAQYVGKEITVEAEVQDVLSPRLLTIDDREPFDLDGDILVSIQAPYASLVSEAARVTVTGTVRPLVRAEIDRELRWVDENTASIEVGFERRPMIVARSIKSSDGMELTVRVEPQPPSQSRTEAGQTTGGAGRDAGKPAATSGAAAAMPSNRPAAIVTDVSQLVSATDTKLVGRQVNLSAARVMRAADKQSFWVSDAQGRDSLLVVPADASAAKVSEGQTVTITGFVMEMPRAWQDKFSTTQGTDERVYVWASTVAAGK